MDKFGRFAVAIISLAVLELAFITHPVGRSQEQSNAPVNRSGSSNRSIGEPKPSDSTRSVPQDPAEATWKLPADADKTKNPVATSEESIAKGKELYFARKGNCVFCHGDSGAGNEENMAQLRRKPADLTNKERMSKMTDGEIFWKISLGIPGIMPGRDKQLTEEERWHVVNYVRTLAKEKPSN